MTNTADDMTGKRAVDYAALLADSDAELPTVYYEPIKRTEIADKSSDIGAYTLFKK